MGNTTSQTTTIFLPYSIPIIGGLVAIFFVNPLGLYFVAIANVFSSSPI